MSPAAQKTQYCTIVSVVGQRREEHVIYTESEHQTVATVSTVSCYVAFCSVLQFDPLPKTKFV